MKHDFNVFQIASDRVRSYFDLMFILVSKEVKNKYRRSFLGYLWSVLNPLLNMVVMAVVFSTMFTKKINNFPVYLFCGLTAFNFMRNSTNAGLVSITKNASLIKKVKVPVSVFVLSKVTACFIDFVFTLVALFIVMIATDATFTRYLLLLPLLTVQIYLFSIGLGFFLGSLHVFFEDIRHIYDVIITIWRYLTPIFYPYESLPDWLQLFVKYANPMFSYVHSFRQICLYGECVDFFVFGIGWIYSIAFFSAGLFFFSKMKKHFILYI